MNKTRDPAAAKWAAIQAIRVSGIVIFIYGVAAAGGKAPWFSGAPTEWAWALALVGAADAFLMPLLLARLWSSDR